MIRRKALPSLGARGETNRGVHEEAQRDEQSSQRKDLGADGPPSRGDELRHEGDEEQNHLWIGEVIQDGREVRLCDPRRVVSDDARTSSVVSVPNFLALRKIVDRRDRRIATR